MYYFVNIPEMVSHSPDCVCISVCVCVKEYSVQWIRLALLDTSPLVC